MVGTGSYIDSSLPRSRHASIGSVAVLIQALLYPEGHPDPFTPYAAILPGRSFALVMGRYSCHRELFAPVFEQEPVFAASFGQSS